ncbi:MAG: hypothetical protein ABI867_44125 [Kofleriaceae bacterium]
MPTRWLLVIALTSCAASVPRPADYGVRVATDLKAYADRECQCAERLDAACSKQNTRERARYTKHLDRSRPFSASENLAIDAATQRYDECARWMKPVVLE